MKRRFKPKDLVGMANPEVTSHLMMFVDDDLRKQIEKDLISDIQLEGLDPTGVAVGPQLCGRVKPGSETLINSTGSGTIVQVIYNESPIGSLYYTPQGWTYGHRFGHAGGMFALLDMVGGFEEGHHYNKYNGDKFCSQ